MNVIYTFFLSDHLGSTTLTVLPNGVQAGRMLYKAFGEQRHSSGTTPTDYRYTGQLSQMTDTGLYYYGARWYDPALGRFTQADTMVPLESQGVQAWDRYAYSNNNPIKYTDPTGHWALPINSNSSEATGYGYSIGAPELVLIIIGVAVIAAAIDGAMRRHGVNGFSDFDTPLAESFRSNEMAKFGEGEQIDTEEFTNMLDVVYEDLSGYPRTPIDISRADYDTPFFNGNNRSEPNKYADRTVCIADKCSFQSAVNYVAQGMYSASAGESLEGALKWPSWWNNVLYGHDATPDELYWTEYGYNYYKNKQDNSQEK